MNKVFDTLKEEFIDASEIEIIAPPERYQTVYEDDYHLKTVAVYKDGIFVGIGMLDESKQLLFSGFISCKHASDSGFIWETEEDE